MTKLRNVVVIALVGIFAVIAIGYYFVLSPQKTSAAKVRQSVAAAQDTNSSLQLQLQRLKKQETQVPAQQARIVAIEGRIPSSPSMPSYVRFLNTAASGSHVELVSVAPSTPTAVTVVAPVAPVAAPAATASASAPAAAAAPAPAPAALSSITVTMNIIGGYFAVQQFVTALENSGRATVVSSITIAPGTLPKPASSTAGQAGGTSYKTLQTTIVATIFMSNTPPASAASATPAPGATASASPVPSTATNS